jgi:hypothetical protein
MVVDALDAKPSATGTTNDAVETAVVRLFKHVRCIAAAMVRACGDALVNDLAHWRNATPIRALTANCYELADLESYPSQRRFSASTMPLL